MQNIIGVFKLDNFLRKYFDKSIAYKIVDSYSQNRQAFES